MLINHIPIFSTNKKSDSVRRYVNELCVCVFMDDKHFRVSSCSFVPGSFENSANHSELLFAPPYVLSISPVKKEEDIGWHLSCLQSTEKMHQLQLFGLQPSTARETWKGKNEEKNCD